MFKIVHVNILKLLILVLFTEVLPHISSRMLVNADTSIAGKETVKKTTVVNEDKGRSVLMYLPHSVHSSTNPFVALAKGLANNGHFVTMVVPKRFKELSTFNGGNLIQQIAVPNDYDKDRGMDRASISAYDRTKVLKQCFNVIKGVHERIYELHKRALTQVDMKTLLESKDIHRRFSVVIVQAWFNEVGYFLAHHFNAPLILMMGSNMNTIPTIQLGYFDNPAFVTLQFSMFGQGSAPDFFTRLTTFLIQYFLSTLRSVLVVSQQETLLKALNLTTDENVDLLSLEREAEFGFYSTHYTLDSVRPTLQNTVDVGFIHCRPPTPLNKELQHVFEQSTNPVIYVSFGSLVDIENLNHDVIRAMTETFRKLPYRIVIRSKKHHFDMDNVKTCEWCPQQDILGHPKTALFISHAGSYSIQEAIYHKVPVVAIPVELDQFANAERVERKGFGKRWRVNMHKDAHAMEDDLYRMIVEIVEHNKSYQAYIDKLNMVMMESQMETPLERAIFWTEYVMANQGAPFLKSPSRHVSYFKLLYFDIYTFLVCVLTLFVFFTYKCALIIRRNFMLKLRSNRNVGIKQD